MPSWVAQDMINTVPVLLMPDHCNERLRPTGLESNRLSTNSSDKQADLLRPTAAALAQCCVPQQKLYALYMKQTQLMEILNQDHWLANRHTCTYGLLDTYL